MLIDAVPQYTLLHGRLKDAVDPYLDVTGLWQGSWELFAPSPDHVNVRVRATLHWSDGTQTAWEQPCWHTMSPLQKMREFRKMSYYDGLWRPSNRAAWSAFCEKLVELKSPCRAARIDRIVMYQDRDVIPPPTTKWRPAYAAPDYTATYRIHTWVNHD